MALEPLSQASALAMFDETFPGHEGVRRQDHFRIALADTGYVPRIIQYLLDLPLGTDVATANWGERLASLYLIDSRFRSALQLEEFGGGTAAESIIHFALTAQPLEREFVLPGGVTVAELERKGVLLLVPVAGCSGFLLRLPFVQLFALNRFLLAKTGRMAFDPALLFSPTPTNPWRWQHFEMLHAHFQAMRMKALLAAQQASILAARDRLNIALKEGLATKNPDRAALAASQSRDWAARLASLQQEADKGFSLAHVCRGAVGHPLTLARRVRLEE